MGANIKIQSESKQFITEMKQVTDNLKLVDSTLSVATEKAKLFGSATDALKGQQAQLSNSLQGSSKILDLQGKTLNALVTDVDKYKARNAELAKSITDVEAKLKESIKTTGEDSKETKDLVQELNKLQNEFNSNSKAMDKANSSIDKYKIKMNETEKAILQDTKALEEMDKKISTQKLEKFSDATGKAGSALAKLSVPIIGAGVASAKLASDLNESQNKVEVAFGKSSKTIEDWSNTTLKSFGIAKGTALDMASLFGDMGTSMGFTQDKAADMSKSLVGLAGDLSSFKNININEAETALNGIFSGETESLKRLGIVMTEQNLLQYAVSKGMIQNKTSTLDLQKAQLEHEKAQKAVNDAVKKYGANSMQAREEKLKLSEIEEKANQGAKASLDTLTQQEKVQLRYNYVMDMTKNAHGDFARTADGTANSTRKFTESLKQLGESFGQNILPIVTPIIQKLTDMTTWLGGLDNGTQKTILALGGLVIGLGAGLIAVSKISSAIVNCHDAIKLLGDGFSTAKTFIGGGIEAIASFGKATGEALISVGKMTIELATQAGSWIAQKIALVASTIATGAMTAAQAALNFVMSLNPLTLIIIGLTALVAGIVVAYNKVDWFRNMVNGAFTAIKNTAIWAFNGIKDFLVNWGAIILIPVAPFLGIPLTIMQHWSQIKEFFSNLGNWLKQKLHDMFSFELPHIKLPHFSLTGEFSLSKGTIPHLGVEWYAKGGIMTQPTVFGMNGNNAMVGGEAGAEAVLPLQQLWNELNKNFDRLEQRLNVNKQQIFVLQNQDIYMDGQKVGRITSKYSDQENAWNTV